jgi:hypothetical protein
LARTGKQELGDAGERAVRDLVPCPKCGRARHLTPLAANFQCADLICKFCGYLAQVKSVTIKGTDLPERILGAAWGPQHEQIVAGIFQPLFVCAYTPAGDLVSIDYIPAHILQAAPDVFEPRKPLSASARRAGWTGFYYNLTRLPRIGIKRVYSA